MPKNKPRPYETGLRERLRSSFEHSVNYVRAAAEDSKDGFLLALRDVAEARIGMSDLANAASLNRENLYRMLSEEGNPRLESLWSVAEALGLRITVEAISAPSADEGQTEKKTKTAAAKTYV
jgi:probable addiction module antidote protein